MGANGERITRSDFIIIVTGRRVGQGAGQEKGSGVRAELPFFGSLQACARSVGGEIVI